MSRPSYKASKIFFLFSKINNPQIELLQATKETSQVVYNIEQESCLGQISCRANESRAQEAVDDFCLCMGTCLSLAGNRPKLLPW